MFAIGKAVLWESLLHFFRTRADTTAIYTIPECIKHENLGQMIDTLKFDGINELSKTNKAEKKRKRRNMSVEKGNRQYGKRVSRKRSKRMERSSEDCSWSETNSSE